jgi:hypothetical protein
MFRAPGIPSSCPEQSADHLGIPLGFDPRRIEPVIASGNNNVGVRRLFIDDDAPPDVDVAHDPELRRSRCRDSGEDDGSCKHLCVHVRHLNGYIELNGELTPQRRAGSWFAELVDTTDEDASVSAGRLSKELF